MPPKKKIIPKTDDMSIETEPELEPEPIKVFKIKNTEPHAFIKSNTGDSDRLQLASAINNLVFKGSSFVDALATLTNYSNERLTQLDIQIEAKKQEYNELIHTTESEHKHKTKILESDHATRMKALDAEFKNNQIDTKQKLSEFKLEACKKMAQENNMLLIEKSENDRMYAEKNQALKELKEIKDSFTAKINENLIAEKKTYDAKLAQEKLNADLSHRAHTAELTAQVAQQIKEIAMLNKTIDNLKSEIAEQRNLTREVANAGSKGQITQNIGKNN